ncbi:unnamed protein product [Pleuronectes platessa]|uniref:Uncharacterized protein n=1 Tax=Pleuronectes platessa TaxID=8262 RepID=A0A9N7VRK7_PLEPL|nr:unnamed protein product [Pleuronectes platessa]
MVEDVQAPGRELPCVTQHCSDMEDSGDLYDAHIRECPPCLGRAPVSGGAGQRGVSQKEDQILLHEPL